jgi:hypothetical protein
MTHSPQICLCFGGEVKEEVRSNVSMFLDKLKTDDLNLSEWNGDRLADLIEQHMWFTIPISPV